MVITLSLSAIGGYAKVVSRWLSSLLAADQEFAQNLVGCALQQWHSVKGRWRQSVNLENQLVFLSLQFHIAPISLIAKC